MPIKPKFSIEKIRSNYRGTDEFTNREEYIRLFRNRFALKKQHSHEVVVFYGIGGIGKTSLRKKLSDIISTEYPDIIWSIIDFETPSRREEETALYLLRRELSGKYKIHFHSFDIAYSIYWKKTHPHKPFNKETFKLLEESKILSELIGILSHFHIIGLIPKITFLLAEGKHNLNTWWKKRGQKELSIISGLEPKEILDRLPMYFASDLREELEERRCVFFLDSYEALWENHIGTGSFFKKDEWIRELIAQLPEPLWVIGGRDKLRWNETDSSWNEIITQHSLNELSEKDAKIFLQKCKIEDNNIQNVIIKASRGVPYYMDLAVDTYFEIKQLKGRDPAARDFAKTQMHVTDRLLKYMDTVKTETLKVMSLARSWDNELACYLIDKFKTGYPITAISELCNYSFINHDVKNDTYSMHNLMREGLSAKMEDWLKNKVHETIFEYYDRFLLDLDFRNISIDHYNYFRETFYHKSFCTDQQEFYKWFFHRSIPFKRSSNLKFLIPFYEEMLVIIETKLGKINDNYIQVLSDLALSLWKIGLYDKAIECGKETLKYKVKLSGTDDIDYASYLNNLAVIYYSNGDNKQSMDLHYKALDIKRRILGDNDIDVAKTIDNLALVYIAKDNYKKAAELQEQAANILRNNPGTDNFFYSQLLHNLGVTYYHQENYEKAVELFSRSLDIKLKELGHKHASLVITYNNLADSLYNIGKYEAALEYCKNSRSIIENTYDENHKYAIFNNDLMIKILNNLNEKFVKIE